MTLTLSTFFTSVIFSSVFLPLFVLFSRKGTGADKTGIYAPLALYGVVIMRLMLPFEWKFSKTIPLTGIYTKVMDFFRLPIFAFRSYNFTVFHGLMLINVSVILFKIVCSIKRQSSFRRRMRLLPVVSREEYINLFGRTRSVPCLEDPTLHNALAFGLVNPVIVLPSIPLSENERQMIIRHELAHLRLCDLWIKSISHFICTVFWWNPLLFWLKQQASEALEIRVDRCVTREFTETQNLEYSECLLRFAKLNIHEAPLHVTSLISSKGTAIQKRFALILDDEKRNAHTLSGSFIALLLIIAVGSVLIVFEPHHEIPDDVKATTMNQPAFNSSFLVRRDDGEFDLYLDGAYYAKILDSSSFENLKVYNNIEEVQNGHFNN